VLEEDEKRSVVTNELLTERVKIVNAGKRWRVLVCEKSDEHVRGSGSHIPTARRTAPGMRSSARIVSRQPPFHDEHYLMVRRVPSQSLTPYLDV
jgi:hypothetical protein